MTDAITRRAEAERQLERVRALARLWDEAITIPVLGIKIGLDAIVGLVPGAGDLVGLAVSLYPIAAAVALRAGPSIVARMGWNVLVDAVIGAIPILGDLFDVAWRANSRNRDLLDRWARDPNRVERQSGAVLLLIGGGAIGLAAGLVWLAVRALELVLR